MNVLKALKVTNPPLLFQYLTKDCRPITTKSRRHSNADCRFISTEIRRLLAEGIIEPSTSPWRAQVVVTSNENHKKRMCIDYSQTINKFTLLDGYPLPRMKDVINKVSQYHVFSTLDLKNAYHQVELPKEARIYAAFEADGQLFQFTRLPFGLKNAVPCFQRIIDRIIKENDCVGTYAYLDNITFGGKTQENTTKTCKDFWMWWKNTISLSTKVNVFFLLLALICWDTKLRAEHSNRIQSVLNQYWKSQFLII